MKTTSILIFLGLILFFSIKSSANDLKFHSFHHASFIIESGNYVIFVDPTGDVNALKKYPTPDLILITHTHGDHFNPEMLASIKGEKSIVIGNKDAIDQLGYGIFLMNGEKKMVRTITVEAVPMYNTTEDRQLYHPKGIGNGYILNINDERIYISGDTEDTRELRNLKNIDHAFLCMNLPFTMTPEQAAAAVIDFQPKKVYPYHYSQTNGFADIEKFKKLVGEKCSTEVVFFEWYKQED